MAIYLVVKRKYKQGFISFLVFLIFFGYLNYYFPLTTAMKQTPLQFHHITDFDYIYALSYGSLIVITAFLFPLFLSVFDIKELLKNKIATIIFGLFCAVLYLLLNSIYQPQEISWGEFPYFENTVERTGFYPRGIHGTKYQFRGNYDLYKYWDLSAKVLFSTLISYVLVFKKLKFNIFLVLIGVYLSMLTLTETHFDRYLLFLFPLFIFYLLSLCPALNLLKKLSTVCFLLFMFFLMYQFSTDFILVNKYVWSKSLELTKTVDIEEKYIHATNAWKLNYINEERSYKYLFSYDSQNVNSDLASLYELVDTHEIKYPINIFIQPKVYLYKLK